MLLFLKKVILDYLEESTKGYLSTFAGFSTGFSLAGKCT